MVIYLLSATALIKNLTLINIFLLQSGLRNSQDLNSGVKYSVAAIRYRKLRSFINIHVRDSTQKDNLRNLTLGS